MLNFWKFEITQVFGFSQVIVLTQIEPHKAYDLARKSSGALERWNKLMPLAMRNVIVSVDYTNGQIAKLCVNVIKKLDNDTDVVFVCDDKGAAESCGEQLDGFLSENHCVTPPLCIGLGALFQSKDSERKNVGSAF